ncbi:hypothetical protein NLM33_37320 [Bradyrhizobium sp. CCGUVB1N3]|uniref:ImmA/IrrE family metallo-endopeptidase n=1 Tax=Bradyrhizobium sp. CCGUVB1N3 TaxID=2949629 RepID=UPI0020B33C12|nr:hypothetical protein [Bradyrhizobium sp. CCGUVB1N3]MCP3475905.1 hypothetical protein [Bradyrhizobium sp. CCGUVB1N3]
MNKQIEQQAHRFAGAFLFPREAFRFEVTRPTLDYFRALKKRRNLTRRGGLDPHRSLAPNKLNPESVYERVPFDRRAKRSFRSS